MFSKGRLLQRRQKASIWGKGLTRSTSDFIVIDLVNGWILAPVIYTLWAFQTILIELTGNMSHGPSLWNNYSLCFAILLSYSLMKTHYVTSASDLFRKYCGKSIVLCHWAISTFATMFSTLVTIILTLYLHLYIFFLRYF